MRVIKEGWMLRVQGTGDVYMLMQNTTTPKMYVSEKSAISSANYYAEYKSNGVVMHEPVKAYIVVEGDSDAIPF